MEQVCFPTVNQIIMVKEKFKLQAEDGWLFGHRNDNKTDIASAQVTFSLIIPSSEDIMSGKTLSSAICSSACPST